MNTVGSQLAHGDLATTVNLLQQELEATNREVMLLTLELEQRVAERTAQLVRSNQQLVKEVAERIRAEAEIKKLNEDLASRAALLEVANEELEAFSSSVSHDLRNPLSRILGFATLLQERFTNMAPEKQQRYLSQILDAGRKMSALIEDLLRLSHASKIPLVWTAVNLNDLVSGVITDITSEPPTSHIEWIRGPLPTVGGDVSLLRQVFVNLLSNAVKYSREQNAPRIEIGEAPGFSPGHWTIFVHDNGVGFDSSKADKLFGAFQRLHSDHQFEGVGLGLANVKRIVLRHGGRVWAESRPGRGAIFFVSLPHSRPDDLPNPA
jgi:signal transduction histidine kinase